MIDFEDNDIAFVTDKGEKVLTNEYVRKMRETDLRNPYKYTIIAQDGGQEDMLAIDADIKICGGSRGGSKSFSALLEGVYDIEEPDFHALILRKEKDDLQSLVSDSYKVYSQFGTYNKSKDDMTWNFYKGGWLKFSYYEGTFKDFKDRFQGRQFAYVCIDEGTQCPYKKFKYLLTNNRNASGLRNRFWITCNPDPESWVRKFIDWWVGEDGQIIPERNGVIRYCFMEGDSPDSIFWGDTREEVYLQCKSIIDGLWKEKYEQLGYTKLDMFVQSVTFIRADVSENIKLCQQTPHISQTSRNRTKSRE